MGQDFLDMQYYKLTFVFKQTYVEIETYRDRNQKKEDRKQKKETAIQLYIETEKQKNRETEEN